ncbi:MAG: hypothetical protein JRC77_03955 [Deltaproteobacteria bacterium]|nr:hypothetical protein [Deltaproteobacteria bacterium]
MKNWFFLGLLALVLSVQACSDAEQANKDCESAMGDHLISYTGGLEGSGKLRLRAIPGGKMGALQAQLTLYRSPSNPSDVLIQFQGMGSCVRGEVSVNFSAVAGQNKELRVVGGSLSGPFRSGLDPAPSGRWQLDLLGIENGEQVSAESLWQVIGKNPF